MYITTLVNENVKYLIYMPLNHLKILWLRSSVSLHVLEIFLFVVEAFRESNGVSLMNGLCLRAMFGAWVSRLQNVFTSHYFLNFSTLLHEFLPFICRWQIL